MIRYHARWAVLLTLLFVLPVAWIRAQSYDDSELRAFLTPPAGCPAPCFMGIRPGETTAEEALAILERHEWVLEVSDVDPSLWEDPDGEGLNFVPIVTWKWNGTQPNWIEQQYEGSLWLVDGQVLYLEIYTLFAMGDILLALDFPDKIDIYSNYNMFGHVWVYSSWYSDEGILIEVWEFCPGKRSYLLSGQTTMIFQKRTPEFYGSDSFSAVCKD